MIEKSKSHNLKPKSY